MTVKAKHKQYGLKTTADSRNTHIYIVTVQKHRVHRMG